MTASPISEDATPAVFRWDGKSFDALNAFMGGKLCTHPIHDSPVIGRNEGPARGDSLVSTGDFVMRDVFGFHLIKADVAEALRAALSSHSPTMGQTAWRCFHCDEVFTDERSAREHFGETQGDDAACTLNCGERELLIRFREVSKEAAELRVRLDQAEYDCGASVRADIGRTFKCAHTVQDAFNLYDSMEGRALAAEEEVLRLRSALADAPGKTDAKQGEAGFSIDAALNEIEHTMCACCASTARFDFMTITRTNRATLERFRKSALADAEGDTQRLNALQTLVEECDGGRVSLSGTCSVGIVFKAHGERPKNLTTETCADVREALDDLIEQRARSSSPEAR